MGMPGGKLWLKQRVVDGQKEQMCSKCGVWKTSDHFYETRANRGGLSGSCKDCHRPVVAKYNDSKRSKSFKALTTH